MERFDRDAPAVDLDRAEIAAYADLWAAAPEDLAAMQGIADATLDGVHCSCVASLAGVRILNHALGFPADRPADESTLDRVERFFSERGLPTLITVREGAPVERQLAARGYVRDYPWVKFARDLAHPAGVETDLETKSVTACDAAGMGRLLAASFDLPPELAPWLAALPGRTGWHCLGSYDGPELVGTGSLYVHGDSGYLGFAATDPVHRGRRAQKALLAARITLGRELGLRLLVTETGEVEQGRPDASHRNILGAGFNRAYRRPFWRLPA